MAQIKVLIPDEVKYGAKVKVKAKLGEKQDQVLGAPPPKRRRKPATNPQDGTSRR